MHDALQPVLSMACVMCLGPASGRGVTGLQRRHRDDRQLLRPRSPAGAGAKKGELKLRAGTLPGGLTTKIHALVDAEGRPVQIELTAGQAGDAPTARTLLETVATSATVLAYKAYDTDGIRAFVAARGGWANIPPRTTRKGTFAVSRWVYRQRNLVERFFNRLKQMREIATRYDRRAETTSQQSNSPPFASGSNRYESTA